MSGEDERLRRPAGRPPPGAAGRRPVILLGVQTAVSGYSLPRTPPASSASADLASGATGTVPAIISGLASDGQKALVDASVAVGSDQLVVSQPIFAAGDVNKSINVMRQDVNYGWNPWWNNNTTPPSIPRIIGYTSPTQVTIDRVGSIANSGNGKTYPTQSWPYAKTPAVVMWGTANDAALRRLISQGGRQRLPAGNFCFTQVHLLPSGTILEGAGPATNLMPLGVLAPAGSTIAPPPFLTNTAMRQEASYNTAKVGWGNVATLRASIGDHDIALKDFAIDMSLSGMNTGNLSCRFFLVERMVISRLVITGVPTAPFEAPNFMGCDHVLVIKNTVTNTNGFSPWVGCTNIHYWFNTVTVPEANSQTGVTWGGYGPLTAFQINVVGTASGDDQYSNGIDVSHNTIFMHGAKQGGYLASTAIIYFPDGGSSIYKNCRITGNRIFCSGANNVAISVNGGSVGVEVTDNEIEGADGGGGAIIAAVSEAGSTASPSTIVSFGSVNGSRLLTVDWPSHGFSGVCLGVMPAFFLSNWGTTVGGIGCNQYFEVSSVPDANTLIIRANTPATSTQTVAWAGNYAQVLLLPIGLTIARNTIKDCNAPGADVISVTGIACTTRDNKAVYTNGSTVGDYRSLVRYNTVNNQPPGAVINNTGPTGQGSLSGYVGSNRISHNPYEPVPLIVDPHD